MVNEIPALKIKPNTISKILAIIIKNEYNYDKITENIYDYLITLSNRNKKPSVKNLVRAVSLPSLRHLKLIEGDKNDIHLTSQGKYLYKNSIDNIGNIKDNKFRKEFAKYIIKLEKKYYLNIINELKKREEINVRNFIKQIEMEYNIKIIDDRMKRWLNYLEYVGFITVIKRKILINGPQIKNAESEDYYPAPVFFREKLIESYFKLAQHSTFLGYVPIPLLKNEVCQALEKLWDQDFYDLLLKIKREDQKHVIAFSEPMKWVEGGIRIDGKYYYYIYIREKGDMK